MFDWKYYVTNNIDLQKAGIDTEAKALRHWKRHGKKEGRTCYKIPTTHYFLFYYNEDISAFQHPNITPIKLEDGPNSVFFETRGYLQIDINTIPNVDNIGFLTPSILRKSRFRDIHQILKLSLPENTVGGFAKYNKNILRNMVTHHSIMSLTLWNYILNRTEAYAGMTGVEFPGSHSNMFITKREIAVKFIEFMQQIIGTMNNMDDKHKNILYSNSQYRGKLTKSILLARTGYPHYTYHAFLCERFIGLYAKKHGYNYIQI